MVVLVPPVSLEVGSIPWPHLRTLLLAACVGLGGGVTSGLFGVSPGGALVVLAALLLGAEQHIAQGISLAAQIPPTSLGGARRYHKEGNRCPMSWLPWLASGLLVGGVAGAIGAARVSTSALRGSYVIYLGVLDLLLILRSAPREAADDTAFEAGKIHVPALLAVGLVAGLSSGYLGIGGGLAIVAGLAGGLRVPQHRAQALSLLLSVLPTTMPAAYVYWRQGLLPPWPILAATILGLWAGTLLGARAANRLRPPTLRRALIVTVTAMTAYMAYRTS
jgi:uncharacterized protein